MSESIGADRTYHLGLSPEVLGISVFNFILFLAWQMSVPAVPLLALNLGASPFWIGLVVGVRAILPLVLALPAGWLTDRLPSRELQAAASLTMLAATTLMWRANSIIAVIVGQALLGLAVMIASVVGQALIALATNPRARDRVYGSYSFIIALASVLGPGLGGLFIRWSGPGGAMLVACAFALLSLLQALRLPSRGALVATARTGPAQPAFSVLQTPAVLFSLMIGFLVFFGYSLQSSFYVLFLHRAGFDSVTIGLLLAFAGAATISIRPLLAYVTGRVGRTRLLAVVCLALGAGLGLIPVTGGSLAGQAGLAALIGLAYGLSQPLTITVISHAVPGNTLGLAFAWRQIFQRAGELVSPLVLGLVVSVAGLAAAFWSAATVLMAAALAAFFLANRVPRTKPGP